MTTSKERTSCIRKCSEMKSEDTYTEKMEIEKKQQQQQRQQQQRQRDNGRNEKRTSCQMSRAQRIQYDFIETCRFVYASPLSSLTTCA